MSRLMIVVLATCAVAPAGCANLKVTKITEAKRLKGKDEHVKGFRYYLSRPYVVIKDDIRVSESVYITQRGEAPPGIVPADGVGDTNDVPPPLPPHIGRLTPEEWSRMRDLVRPDTPGGGASAPPAPIDPGFQLAQYVADDPETEFAAAAAQVDQLAGDAAAAETVPSGVGTQLGIPKAEAVDNDTVDLKGSIQIIFLPDLDEQYAVHNHNFLSKSAYGVNFKNGWELTNAEGEFDSTTVAIELFNFIDSAVNSAKDVALAGINRQARILDAAAGDEDSALDSSEVTDGKRPPLEKVTVRLFLRKGIYRINKPWEIQGIHDYHGAGLLQVLGLPVDEEVIREPYLAGASLGEVIAR